MAWNASTDFKFDPGDFNKPDSSSGWGGSFGDAYKTDWNKDFTKNTEEGKNKGLDFLKGFAKNLFGGQNSSSGSPWGGDSKTYGASFNPFTSDIGVIQTGSQHPQVSWSQPGWGEKIANAALGAIPALL